MDAKQIESYEFCKSHLIQLRDGGNKLPYKPQMYGCGSRDPRITFELQEIHNEMMDGIKSSILNAQSKIQEIIDKI